MLTADAIASDEKSVEDGQYEVVLRALDEIISTEMICLQTCEQLVNRIASAGTWTHPIPVDSRTGLIMDGNHRFQAAKALGLKRVPCVQLHYGDHRIDVLHWSSGSPFPVESIYELSRTGKLFPYKTTRHLFKTPLPEISIPLRVLC